MNQQEKDLNAAASQAPDAEGAPESAKEPARGEAAEVTATDEAVATEKDELQTLRAELEQARAKAEENWNLYLSAQAEVQNIRKRAERDLQNAHKYALEKFVSELLPVKDSLEMGIAAASETDDVAKLKEGSELTLKMLTAATEKFSVQEINPVGLKFNPEQHEAMAMQPSEQAEPNTVLQVIQKGYLLNDRLVRPAMVIVAQAAQKEA